MTRLQELAELIRHYDYMYYVSDEPEVSDAEYDALKAEFEALGGTDDMVPGQARADLPKHKHTIAIRSLEKVNTEADLRAAIERLWPVIIQPKIDGLTIVTYPSSKGAGLVPKFTTRGNGEEGENVTDTALKMSNVAPLYNAKAPIRAEAFIRKSVLVELNKEREAQGLEPFKNCRNAAAGMLRQKDTSQVKGIEYLAYNVVGSVDTESGQLSYIKSLGIPTIPYGGFKTVDDAVRFVINYNRDKLDFDIDGMVIKSDRPNSLAEFGETGHHPKNAVAYKFPSQGAWTTLKDVTWQVGRTGKLTPVAELEPVDVLGSTISRATLHNIAYVRGLDLWINQEVLVVKANDVIPAVTKARSVSNSTEYEIKEPTMCPICRGKVDKVKDQHFCNNPLCGSKLETTLVHWAKQEALNIDGLGGGTAKAIADSGMIKTPYEVFSLTADQLATLPGFAKKSGTQLYNAIQKARKAELANFLYAGGLPEIGRSASRDIAGYFGTFANLIIDVKSGGAKLLNIPGIGSTMLQNVLKYHQLWINLFAFVTPIDAPTMAASATPAKPGVKSLSFVITGTLSAPRSQVESDIRRAGHNMAGSVSAKTDYVVIGDAPGGTKYNKAISLGFDKNGKMITESQLYKILRG